MTAALRGKPGPKPYPPGVGKEISFRCRMTPEDRDKLRILAKDRKTNASQLIRAWIARAWSRR